MVGQFMRWMVDLDKDGEKLDSTRTKIQGEVLSMKSKMKKYTKAADQAWDYKRELPSALKDALQDVVTMARAAR